MLAIKRKNAINEPLFTPWPTETIDDLNPYSRIIADEALRRGIRRNPPPRHSSTSSSRVCRASRSHGHRNNHGNESPPYEMSTAVGALATIATAGADFVVAAAELQFRLPTTFVKTPFADWMRERLES